MPVNEQGFTNFTIKAKKKSKLKQNNMDLNDVNTVMGLSKSSKKASFPTCDFTKPRQAAPTAARGTPGGTALQNTGGAERICSAMNRSVLRAMQANSLSAFSCNESLLQIVLSQEFLGLRSGFLLSVQKPSY
jgi:hypothetical protein